MALILALILLALRTADCASLPTPLASPEPSLNAPQVLDTLEFLDAPVVGRELDAFHDGDDIEPIALLIGKDVKRVMRRKGLSDGKLKVFRRREQHKDLESHYHGSHEWAPQDSELDHILDPVSLEDPKDVELKKAIAQLIKEVADREEKRKKKQHLDSNEMKEKNNEGNIKEFDGNVSEKDLNLSTDRHDDLKASHDDLSDDRIDENHDKVDDHQDGVFDAIENFGDTEYRSGSIYLDGDLNLNVDDFVSSKSNYNYQDDRVSQQVKNNPKKTESLIHDEIYRNEQHNVDDDLKAKENEHHSRNGHVSKEFIQEANDDKHVMENINNFDNLDNITLKKTVDGIGENKLEHDSDNEIENENQNRNSYKDHDHENHHYDDSQPNTDANLYLNEDRNSKNEVQDESKSLQNQDYDIKRTEQKDKEELKTLLNVNPHENILNENNHYEKNNFYESDQIQEHEYHYDSKDSQHYSLENYDIPNHGDRDEKQQSKDEEAQKLVNLLSKDDNDVTNNRHSDGYSRKAEIENDNRQNDLNSKEEEKNPTNNAVEEYHTYDSVEIPRYYHLPQRRYRLRKQDKISKSYPSRRNRAPIKQYALSFFLRK